MDELNKASEALSKLNEEKVRVVFFQPMTMVKYWHDDGGRPFKEGIARKGAQAIIKKFIDDVDLYKLKPDMRIFGFGHGDIGGWEMWVTIPDSLEIPAPFEKVSFWGGLYAVCKASSIDDPEAGRTINEWLDSSDEYEGHNEGVNRPGMYEYINPYNFYGLLHSYSEEKSYMYTDFLIPIREIKKYTDDEKNALLADLEEPFTHGKSMEIDLTSLINPGNNKVTYTDGLMLLRTDEKYYSGMTTPQKFTCPLKVELRVKSNGEEGHNSDVFINYAKGTLGMNIGNLSNIAFFDIKDGSFNYLTSLHHVKIPVDEFADIEWIISKGMMAVKVNGKYMYFDDRFEYINEYKINPGFNLSSSVSIATSGEGETLTVESLRVT